MKLERRTVLFSGQVQGVGFRMTAVHLSRDLAVSGTIRNLEDGRVELVAQGEAKAIDALLSRLGEHFGGLIRNMHQVFGPADNRSAGRRGLHVV